MLSAAEIAFFRREGFVVVREAFAPEVATACRQAIHDWVLRSYEIDTTQHGPQNYFGNYFFVPFQSGPPFDALNSKRVLGALDAVLGVGRYEAPQKHGNFWVSLPSRGSSRHDPQLTSRWHIDLGRHATDSFRLTAGGCGVTPIWLLTDATATGGATAGFPGSHRLVSRLLATADAFPAPELDAFCEAYAQAHASEMVHLEGKAGDFVICHPHLIHAATANTGDAVRIICNTGIAQRDRRLSGAGLSVVEEMIAEASRSASQKAAISRLMRAQLRMQHARVLAGGLSFSRLWDPPCSAPREAVFRGISASSVACARLIERMVTA